MNQQLSNYYIDSLGRLRGSHLDRLTIRGELIITGVQEFYTHLAFISELTNIKL